MPHRDTRLLQHIGPADTRQLQQMRRADRAGREKHLARRVDALDAGLGPARSEAGSIREGRRALRSNTLTASAQSTAPVQANISGRISETSMTTSAGRLSLRAAIRIASAFGAS